MKNYNNKFPNKLFLPSSGKTIWISLPENKVKDTGARADPPSQIRPLLLRGAAPLLPPNSILQNPDKTAVLPVLPPMTPLGYILLTSMYILDEKNISFSSWENLQSLIILECDTLYSELLQIELKGPLVFTTIVVPAFVITIVPKQALNWVPILLLLSSKLATRWHKLCRLWYMSIDSGNLHIPIYVCCHQAISKSRMCEVWLRLTSLASKERPRLLYQHIIYIRTVGS